VKIFESRPDISDMFFSLNEKHFNNEVPDIPVVWNTRMTTTAGYCRYRKTSQYPGLNIYDFDPTKIDLSDRLFKSLGYDIQKIERTLIHEMVHAYLIHKYNEKGHTARFQRMMTDITGERKNHRCHNYDVSEVRREARYTLICHRCGHEHGMSRKPKYSSYKHRGCGGKMISRWPSQWCT
jgi:predicted SprT family Zn-dependent metalloprotease